jgi:hypothetical protein
MATKRTSPGDATGRRKAELAEQHASELAEAAKTMSVATAAQAEIDENALFDPESGSVIETPDGEAIPVPTPEDPDAIIDLVDEGSSDVLPEVDLDEEPANPALDDALQPVDFKDAALAQMRAEFEAMLSQVQAESALREANLRRELEMAKQGDAVRTINLDEVLDAGVEVHTDDTVVARVNTTIEDVTVGAGRHFSFQEGRKYKMPRDVYDRLEELGYIWH